MGRFGLLLILALAAVSCRTYRADERAPQAGGAQGGAGAGSTAWEPDERAPRVPIGSDRAGAGRDGGRRRSDPFEEARRRVDEALALGVPPGNYLVEVEKVWVGEEESSSLGALLAYRDEDVDVRVGEEAADAGLRVAVARGGFRAVLDGFVRSHRSARRETATIVTVPDSPARLEVGTVRFAAPLELGGGAEGTILFPAGQLVGTSLEVTCRPAGPGRVEIEIVPVFSEAGSGASVEVTRARTVVVAPIDRPLLLASHESARDDVATALLRRRTERGEERGVVVLTVRGG